MEVDAKNNIKIISLIIITIGILYVLHLVAVDVFDIQLECDGECDELSVYFEADFNNKTLTVVEIFSQQRDYYWDELSLVSGSADFPYNIIEIGDVVTNCAGYLEIEFERTGKTIWRGDFSQ